MDIAQLKDSSTFDIPCPLPSEATHPQQFAICDCCDVSSSMAVEDTQKKLIFRTFASSSEETLFNVATTNSVRGYEDTDETATIPAQPCLKTLFESQYTIYAPAPMILLQRDENDGLPHGAIQDYLDLSNRRCFFTPEALISQFQINAALMRAMPTMASQQL